MQSWVLMFTGQGSQQIGMGREMDCAPASKAVWDCACDISGSDIRRLCWKGPMNRLSQTRYQQIAVTAVNLAGWYTLKAADLLPESAILIGHSVGEYAALHASGVLDLEATFIAVNSRACLMQAQAEKTDGAMYAVKVEQGDASRTVQNVIDKMGLTEQVVIANDNSPKQVVIAGETAQVKAVSQALALSSLVTIKLPVNGAWHSPMMADMRSDYGALLKSLDIKMPLTSVLMNRSAKQPESSDEIREHLTFHVTDTVRWRETIQTLLKCGHTNFLEIGPRKVLASLMTDYQDMGKKNQLEHCLQRLKQQHWIAGKSLARSLSGCDEEEHLYADPV